MVFVEMQVDDVNVFTTSVCNDRSEQVRLDYVLVLCVQQFEQE